MQPIMGQVIRKVIVPCVYILRLHITSKMCLNEHQAPEEVHNCLVFASPRVNNHLVVTVADNAVILPVMTPSCNGKHDGN